jgi:hypothetical protein
VLVAVSMLSHYAVSPREGHLQQVFHIFAYLKHHKQSKMVFDDKEPVFNESSFKIFNWSELYPDAEEAIPQDCPIAGTRKQCHYLLLHGCGPYRMQATRRSHTGVILYANKAPILWYYSKCQNTTIEGEVDSRCPMHGRSSRRHTTIP